MSTKLELLKLSKKELIKKCKKFKVNSNGTKSEMVDRILSVKNKPKTNKKIKTKNNISTLKTQFIQLISIKDIYKIFLQYLTVYTIINFNISFPNHSPYHALTNIIQKCRQNESKFMESSFINIFKQPEPATSQQDDIVISDSKPRNRIKRKRVKRRVHHRLNRSYSPLCIKDKSKIKIKGSAIDKMAGDYGFKNKQKRPKYNYNKEYKLRGHRVIFTREHVYNIDYLLEVLSEISDSSIYKQLKKDLDVISWVDVMNYGILDKDKDLKRLKAIYFVYLFLSWILSFDSESRFAVYCSSERYEARDGNGTRDATKKNVYIYQGDDMFKISFDAKYGKWYPMYDDEDHDDY